MDRTILKIEREDRVDALEAAQRVMVYCHDGVGLGHLRRSLTICEHVGKLHPRCCFLLATGTPYYPMFAQPPRVDCIKLPALAKRDDGTYTSKYLTVSFERLRDCREALLLQAAKSYAPDVLLVDKAPLGVCGELLPTLRWLRRNRPEVRIIFGMRDIEDDPRATIRQWDQLGAQPVIEECFDEVWVYGMRQVFDVAARYRLSERIQKKLNYTGYVARSPCTHAPRTDAGGTTAEGRCATSPTATSFNVLITVGGGTDGERVLDTYLQSAAPAVSAMGARSILVGGPDLPPATADRLRKTASRIPGVQWLDFEPCMSCRIRQSDLVVSMGGYNTMCELVVQDKPSLIVPRTKPRLEQTIRATLWEELGAVRMLPDDELSADSLAERVIGMLGNGTQTSCAQLDLGGLQRIGARFRAFWNEEPDRAAAVRM